MKEGCGQKQDALNTSGCSPSPNSDTKENWDAWHHPSEEQSSPLGFPRGKPPASSLVCLLSIIDMMGTWFWRNDVNIFLPSIQGITFLHPLNWEDIASSCFSSSHKAMRLISHQLLEPSMRGGCFEKVQVIRLHSTMAGLMALTSVPVFMLLSVGKILWYFGFLCPSQSRSTTGINKPTEVHREAFVLPVPNNKWNYFLPFPWKRA